MNNQLHTAFATPRRAGQTRSFMLGPLKSFVSLFPNSFAAGTSLDRLSQLRSSTRFGAAIPTDAPSVQVTLGFGLMFSTPLYAFFNSMLEFQSETQFDAVLRNGYSFHITGGPHNEIIAAVIFVMASDGIFIDAVAVSNGSAPGVCQLSSNTFVEDPKHADRSLLTKAGSFQQLGIGRFLLALVSYCGAINCITPERAFTFLKANESNRDFYFRNGYAPLPSDNLTQPIELLNILPSANYVTKAPDTMLLCRAIQPAYKADARRKLIAMKTVVLPSLVLRTPQDSAALVQSPDYVPFHPSSPEAAVQAQTYQDYVSQHGEYEDTNAAPPAAKALSRLLEEASAFQNLDNDDDSNDSVPPRQSTRKDTKAMETRKSPSKPPKKPDPPEKETATAKKAAAKRLKHEKARAAEMLTCEIKHSDKSDFEFDFDNFAVTPTTSVRWEVPLKDYWEPQAKDNKKFQVQRNKPELTHQLTQNEIFAQYPRTRLPLPLGRIKIINKAMEYKTETERKHADGSSRYNVLFLDQHYLDFACAADLNRPIVVDHPSYKPDIGQITIMVSSYSIPTTSKLQSLLDNRPERRALAREVRRVRVDLNWLRGSCRPNIGEVLDQMVLGSKVTRVCGNDIGTANALSLSFSGTVERVQGFLAIPQGHKKVKYHVTQPTAPDPSKPDDRDIWYDLQQQVTNRMVKLQKDLHLELHLRYAPPPPTNTTQIVKLKWLPAPKLKRKRGGDKGIWHGLFAIDLGVTHSTKTLQECSLTQEWVESAFSSAFRDECKDIATNLATNRNKNKYLYIPAGDPRSPDDDPPPADELLTDVTVHYQQGQLDSCLLDSMCSAFHAMGFIAEAKQLALDESIAGCTVDLLHHATQRVRVVFKHSNLVLRKVFGAACSVDKVTQADSSWPMVLVLRTNDDTGSHAITLWNGMIFDSTCCNALRWSQTSLDWCSGQDATCSGFTKVYRLCPEGFGRMLPGSTIRVGTQIRTDSESSNGLCWVRRLPTTNANGEQKKGYMVCYIDGKMAELSQLEVSKYLLNK